MPGQRTANAVAGVVKRRQRGPHSRMTTVDVWGAAACVARLMSVNLSLSPIHDANLCWWCAL